MTLNEINIRDPFVLPYEGKYYMYGTRGATCWGECDGFDVYVSEDLTLWSDPIEAFHKPEGFWADRNYWAPEVHYYNGSFYAFVSFKSQDRCRGTQILKSDSPTGPFLLHSDGPVTPSDWECLDGTLYVDNDGQPYMVFCHEWVQVKDGEVCAILLSSDLKKAISEPILLFKASEPHWSRGVKNGPNYVTDGPFLYQPDNSYRNGPLNTTANKSKKDTFNKPLVMLWSSFSDDGYAQAIARSESGKITGPWTHDEQLLYSKDGGHGMLFHTFEGQLYLTLHTPNVTLKEHPIFIPVRDENHVLTVEYNQ
ncbi:family 43 glycosylhydrolase [Mobilitalea sibirica]|uniref:Family 43 glycosylhydrolase n=1 Tax=Mobilitalea sibirica TaxID=1462919 RepID=A0A8J7HCF6_9FIRM|nr:glycoside hydrolase family 43 protein [Mobilitalea sibirica]MBH1939979.1 family 43 glycosylhydrolase [Mobilitalea sibirica]